MGIIVFLVKEIYLPIKNKIIGKIQNKFRPKSINQPSRDAVQALRSNIVEVEVEV